MKLAVIGTSNTGKTTFIKDFLKKWPMYKTPDKTYREILKEKNLPHSKNSTETTQALIMNFLVDQITEYSKEEFVIFDRSVLDCLAYTSWLHLNGQVSENFMDQQRIMVNHALKLYDVMFFIPLTKAAKIDIENDGFREVDPIFREEIDFIFKAFQTAYHKHDGSVFPKEDCPAVIEIFGTPEERIKMAEFYISENGKPYGEEDSMMNQIVGAVPDELTLDELNGLQG